MSPNTSRNSELLADAGLLLDRADLLGDAALDGLVRLAAAPEGEGGTVPHVFEGEAPKEGGGKMAHPMTPEAVCASGLAVISYKPFNA